MASENTISKVEIGGTNYDLVASNGVYYIEGTGSTAGTWLGSHPDITAYYPGLMVLYKIPVAGASTTKLNINSLGAVTVVRNVTTAISTSYAVNALVLLTYTLDGTTAYWKVADYDSNTKNSAGSSNKVGTKIYLIGGTSQASSVTTYSNVNCYIGTDNCLYSNGSKVSTEDTKVTNTLATTTKAYLTGTSTATTNTGTQVFDTGVYLTTTAGELYATQLQSPQIISASGTAMSITSGSTLYLDSASGASLIFRPQGNEKARFDTSGNFLIKTAMYPGTANTYECGAASYPWSMVHANNFNAQSGNQRYVDMKVYTVGTADTVGVGRISLGNNVAEGTAKNARGELLWYGNSSTYMLIKMGTISANRTVTIRDPGANAYTVATTTTSAVGNTSTPVYVNSSGVVTACSLDSAYLKLTGGTVSGEVNSSANVTASNPAFRNIKAVPSTTEIVAGTTAIPTGEIWVRYE